MVLILVLMLIVAQKATEHKTIEGKDIGHFEKKISVTDHSHTDDKI